MEVLWLASRYGCFNPWNSSWWKIGRWSRCIWRRELLCDLRKWNRVAEDVDSNNSEWVLIGVSKLSGCAGTPHKQKQHIICLFVCLWFINGAVRTPDYAASKWWDEAWVMDWKGREWDRSEKHENRNSVSWWHGKSQVGLFPNVSHKFLPLCQIVS